MRNKGEAILITLLVVFVIGGLSAVGGYLFAPACQYTPPATQGPPIPHIPGK